MEVGFIAKLLYETALFLATFLANKLAIVYIFV